MTERKIAETIHGIWIDKKADEEYAGLSVPSAASPSASGR